MTVLFLSVRTLNWFNSSSSFITVSQYFSVSALAKKSKICISAHCSEYHHRLAVLLRQRTGKKTMSVSVRTVRNIITVSQYFSVSALAKKQYLLISAHCSEYHHRLAVLLLRQRTIKKTVAVSGRTVRNIITVSQYFSVSALAKKQYL
jgi:hypothetical protein